jgi:hypothetical protein
MSCFSRRFVLWFLFLSVSLIVANLIWATPGKLQYKGFPLKYIERDGQSEEIRWFAIVPLWANMQINLAVSVSLAWLLSIPREKRSRSLRNTNPTNDLDEKKADSGKADRID